MNSHTPIPTCLRGDLPAPRASRQAGTHRQAYPHTSLLCAPAPLRANSCPDAPKRSFTLVEMMVVIAIVAILATLLFPAALRSRERARRRQAMTEACSLAIAIKMYQTEHGRWPNQDQDGTDTTYFANNWEVVNILRQPDHPKNDRGRIYLSIQEGSLDDDNNYVDPWGVPYIICMDEDGDRKLVVKVDAVEYENQFTGETAEYSVAESNDTLAGVMAASIGGDDMIASWDEVH